MLIPLWSVSGKARLIVNGDTVQRAERWGCWVIIEYPHNNGARRNGFYMLNS